MAYPQEITLIEPLTIDADVVSYLSLNDIIYKLFQYLGFTFDLESPIDSANTMYNEFNQIINKIFDSRYQEILNTPPPEDTTTTETEVCEDFCYTPEDFENVPSNVPVGLPFNNICLN